MKLYVWVDPYHVSYGSSMCVAVAGSLEEARGIAQGQLAAQYRYGKHHAGFGPMSDLGEPTRVVDLPCAEWYEWEE